MIKNSSLQFFIEISKRKPKIAIHFSIIFLALICGNSLVAQEYGAITYGEAINISGRQRMLSQKISKAYLLQNMGFDNATMKKEMDSCITLFNQQLDLLLNNNNNPSIAERLKKVENFWISYQQFLEKTPNIITAKKIIEENSKLLRLCNDVVKQIEYSYYDDPDHINTDKAELLDIINISGRQRMLSQRLCLYYTAGLTFIKQNTEYQVHLMTVYEEFDLAISQLITSKFNDEKVRLEITKLLFLWHGIKSVETELWQLRLELSEVYEITNKLTEVFELLTIAYQEIYNSSRN